MRKIFCLLAVAAIAAELSAQTPLSREQILAMSSEELSELPLDELMQAVETLGVGSVDELFALIMNKNVSSASKEEESTFTSQLATTVITKEELRSWGATTIEDAFRLIPGMIVSQRHNGVYDIHMRGLNNIPDNQPLFYVNNFNTQLMVDGRSVQNLVSGIIQMDQIPVSIEDVARIEVVRGACSALYGMNAVTGIINIITEKPSAGAKTVSGGAQAGNMDTYIGDFAIRRTFNDKWSAGISANWQHRNRETDRVYIVPQDGIFYDINNAYPANTPVADPSILLDETKFKDATKGGLYSLSDIKRLRILSQGGLYNVFEGDMSMVDRLFPNPRLSRENFGVNGYLRFTPKEDVTLDLTAGYQSSYSMNLSNRGDIVAQCGTTSQTGYVHLEANIRDLRILANYSGGPQDLGKGIDGFKVKSNIANVQAEYTFRIGDEVSLRPGIAYNYLNYEDYARQSADHPGEPIALFGGGSAELAVFSPSLRATWSHNGFGLTGAVRADKTTSPDKWNISYLAAASYKFNENNFLRLNYGRAFRGPNMINTSTDYTWFRDNMAVPKMIFLKGSEDAELMDQSNVEIGYRWRPSPKMLLDAEVFFSKSQDYGALVTHKSAFTITKQEYEGYRDALANGALGGGAANVDPMQLMAFIFRQAKNYTQLEYKNMPFKVYQMGASINLDYIVSSKLILKLNANIQSTRIDDYYEYNLMGNIINQLTNAQDLSAQALFDMLSGEQTYPGFANASFVWTDLLAFEAKTNWNNWTAAEKMAVQDELRKYAIECLDPAMGKGSVDGYKIKINNPNCPESEREQYIDHPLAMYFGLKYGILIRYPRSGGEHVDVGTNESLKPELSNNHKHKATPKFYGMAGAIYKPIKQLNLAAYFNYLGKRTYDTQVSAAKQLRGNYAEAGTELKPKFTLNLKVGYKPTDNVEVFLNANNLLDNDKQEMIYSDKIGGLYTIGVNFGF